MNDQDFRDHVVGSLARMETRLEALPDLEGDVEGLKLARARDRGIVMGLSAAVSVAVTLFKAVVFGR